MVARHLKANARPKSTRKLVARSVGRPPSCVTESPAIIALLSPLLAQPTNDHRLAARASSDSSASDSCTGSDESAILGLLFHYFESHTLNGSKSRSLCSRRYKEPPYMVGDCGGGGGGGIGNYSSEKEKKGKETNGLISTHRTDKRLKLSPLIGSDLKHQM